MRGKSCNNSQSIYSMSLDWRCTTHQSCFNTIPWNISSMAWMGSRPRNAKLSRAGWFRLPNWTSQETRTIWPINMVQLLNPRPSSPKLCSTSICPTLQMLANIFTLDQCWHQCRHCHPQLTLALSPPGIQMGTISVCVCVCTRTCVRAASPAPSFSPSSSLSFRSSTF